jgi:acetoin utilization deacetylase AcuC-like enzyme
MVGKAGTPLERANSQLVVSPLSFRELTGACVGRPGNGTEEVLFREESKAFQYISIHADGIYPMTDGPTGRYDASRHPYVVKLPIPPEDFGMAQVEERMNEAVEQVEAFEPDLIIVSAGFDALRGDPIFELSCNGGLDASDYHTIMHRLQGLANRYCMGRLLAVMEGGYACCEDPDKAGGKSGKKKKQKKQKDGKKETIMHCVKQCCLAMGGVDHFEASQADP